MRAIKLFENQPIPKEIEDRYYAASIIMQGKTWAYFSVMVNTDVIWNDAVGTAGTDGIYIYVSPRFFMSLDTDSQRAFLLAHEVGHIVFRHAMRRMFYQKRGFHSMQKGRKLPFSQKVYNHAGDYVINADLVAHGLEMPTISGEQCGLYDESIATRDDLVDSVFIQLMNKAEEEQENPMDGNMPVNQVEGDESDPDSGDDQSGEGESDEGESGSEAESGESSDEAGSDKSDGDEGEDGESESGSGEGESDESDGDEGQDGSGSGDSDDQDGESGSGAPDRNNSNPDNGNPNPTPSDGHDQHFDPKYDGTPEEQKQAAEDDKAEVQRKVDDALDSLDKAKERGERHHGTSSGFSEAGYRHSGEGEATDVNWREVLADKLTRTGTGGDISWKKIDVRAYALFGIVAPVRVGTLDQVVFEVDVSSSVDRGMLHQTMLELAHFMDLMQPAQGCIVLFVNTEVVSHHECFSGDEILSLDIPSFGGNYLAAGVEWLEKNGIEPDVSFCFTDGYTPDADWEAFARYGMIAVLDSHPPAYMVRDMRKFGVEYIVACDDELAA